MHFSPRPPKVPPGRTTPSPPTIAFAKSPDFLNFWHVVKEEILLTQSQTMTYSILTQKKVCSQFLQKEANMLSRIQHLLVLAF